MPFDQWPVKSQRGDRGGNVTVPSGKPEVQIDHGKHRAVLLSRQRAAAAVGVVVRVGCLSGSRGTSFGRRRAIDLDQIHALWRGKRRAKVTNAVPHELEGDRVFFIRKSEWGGREGGE